MGSGRQAFHLCLTPQTVPYDLPMFVLYEALLYLAFIVAAPYFLLTGALRSKYLANAKARLGHYHHAAAANDIWIHAVSVGEVLVSRPLVERIVASRPETTIVVTTTTLTGQVIAHRLFPAATVTSFPFDFSFAVRRFLDHHQPSVMTIVETEIWPNVTRLATDRGITSLLVNGRISDRSFAKYRAVRLFLGPVLRRFDAILAREETDRTRFIAMGASANRVEVCGNIKFDFVPENKELPFLSEMQRIARGRPLFVAGSTMEGEDEAIISVLSTFIHDLGCFIVLAPRRPERFDVVAGLLRDNGIRFVRRTEMTEVPVERSDVRSLPSQASKAGGGHGGGVDVLLLDSIGELASVYHHAAAAFVGGSLVPVGGHNPIEPVAAGAPVAFGPHMSNFREIASTFVEEQAAMEVRNVDDLVAFVREMIEDDEARNRIVSRGRETVDNNKGAADFTAARILEALDASRSARR